MSRQLDLYHYHAMRSSPTHTYTAKPFNHGYGQLLPQMNALIESRVVPLRSSQQLISIKGFKGDAVFPCVGHILHIMFLKISSWYLKIVSMFHISWRSSLYFITFPIILFPFPSVLLIFPWFLNSEWRGGQWIVPSVWLWRIISAVCMYSWPTWKTIWSAPSLLSFVSSQ